QVAHLLEDRQAAVEDLQGANIFTHVAVGAADPLQRRGLVAQAAARLGQLQRPLAPGDRLRVAALALVDARAEIQAARQFQALSLARQRQRALDPLQRRLERAALGVD